MSHDISGEVISGEEVISEVEAGNRTASRIAGSKTKIDALSDKKRRNLDCCLVHHQDVKDQGCKRVPLVVSP